MVQDERREEDVSASRRQLHDADRAAQSLDNAVHAVFKDVVGFGGFDLAIVSPSDSTFGLSESVTVAHGSGKTWPDGNLTSAKSRQDLRPWLNQNQPRCVCPCCWRENILPRSDTNDNPCPSNQHTRQRARHPSREHRIHRHIASLATELVLTQQGEVVMEVPWDSRSVRPGGVLFCSVSATSSNMGTSLCMGRQD